VPLVTLGLDNDGQEVRVTANDSVVLRLPENPTTGVRWAFDRLEGPLQVVSDRYEQPAGGGIGASAIRVLTLQPRGRGRAELSVKRWQEWEGPSSIDAAFHCVVRIE
jgi:inhibitor of cysteine peptidase